jgi:hypothetical protein
MYSSFASLRSESHSETIVSAQAALLIGALLAAFYYFETKRNASKQSAQMQSLEDRIRALSKSEHGVGEHLIGDGPP